jgi:hypothetical protein
MAKKKVANTFEQASSIGLAPGRRVRIYDAYIEAREAVAEGVADGTFEEDGQEAMSVSDFPTYIGTLFRHRFLEKFTEIQGRWPDYVHDFDVEDFEDHEWSTWGRFPDIPERSPNGPYEQLAVRELPGGLVNIREFGAGFGLTRRLVLSDRLNQISKLPDDFADALARTMSKEAAVNKFQANPTMWDGNALFSSAHGNLGSTALTANETGMNALIAAEQAMDDQEDDEGYPIIVPGGRRTLIVPTELKWIVGVLTGQQLIPNAGGTLLVPNQVAGRYDVIEEPFFTDANNWYMAQDLKGRLGFLAHVTLNGNTTPFLGVENPGVRAILGGDDPYSFEFDEIGYKIRHDFNFVPTEWRGIFGAIVA